MLDAEFAMGEGQKPGLHISAGKIPKQLNHEDAAPTLFKGR